MKNTFLFTSIFLIAFSINALAQPINLSSTIITATSVELDWNTSPCNANVVLHYRVAGTTWPGTIVNPAGAGDTLTGFAANTDYEWRVKCGGCSGNSCWSPTQQFTTNVPIITNAFVSIPIACNGQYTADEMQIEVSQTNPVTTYACIVGTYPIPANPAFFGSTITTNPTTTTTINLNNFQPNLDYFVRIVDSAAYYSGNNPTTGSPTGTTTDGIYHEFGPIVFTEPDLLTADTANLVSNLCTGDCIAEVELTIGGGTMPYSFDITSTGGTNTVNLPAGTTSDILQNLCTDTYDIVATDANGCVTSPVITTFDIDPVAPIVPNTTLSAHSNNFEVQCFGGNNGGIFPDASGGAGGFTYSLDGTNYQTGDFLGLTAGLYTLYYKDANGCVITEQFTLNEPPNLAGSASVTQVVDCYGANTGAITFTVDPANPGIPPYNYSLDNFVTSNQVGIPTFSNLYGDSTYNITVEDNMQCQYSTTVYLAEPTQITFDTIISDYNGFQVSCHGATDGSIEFVNISGGVFPYEYAIDGPAYSYSTTTNYPGLGSATYDIAVMDADGCVESKLITLSDPGQFTISYFVDNPVSCPDSCDAAISINQSNGVEITAGNILYDQDGGTQQTTPYFSNLCGDLTNPNNGYTINAIDDNLCVASTAVNLAENPTFVYSTSSTDDYCSQSNGEASITITAGGDGSYTYLWSDSQGQNTQTATNLTAGIYTVTVTDGEGCGFSEQVTVAADPGYTISFTTTSPCLGPNSGSATVNPSGGTAPYTYQWSDVNGIIIPNSNTQSLVGSPLGAFSVPVGTYSVSVTDAAPSNCVITGTVDVLPLTNAITLDTVIVTSSSCYGIDDAQLEIFVSGGVLPYTYSSNGSLPQSNSDFGPLSPNNYYIQAFDANGCYTDTTIILNYPGLLDVNSVVFTDISCNGADDGAIQIINVTGGTAPFEYALDNGVSQTYMGFSDIEQGWHTVHVLDVNNCGAAFDIFVEEPPVLDVNITTSGWDYNNNQGGWYTYQIRCNGDTTSGYANFAINGGVAPYVKTCIDSNGDTLASGNSYLIDSLSADVYTFSVMDANGCIYEETITFNEPDPIIHNFIAKHVSCVDSSWGALTDSVYGGVGDATSYIYSWNTGDSTYSLTNIPADTFFITVRDENDCLSLDSFIINDDNALAATSLVQDVSCFDACDGEIIVTATGGIPLIDANNDPYYLYEWNTFPVQDSSVAIGLCADNITNSTQYNCVITDDKDCPLTVSLPLLQPELLSVSANIISDHYLEDISCFGADDGEIYAVVEGGASTADTSSVWNATMYIDNVTHTTPVTITTSATVSNIEYLLVVSGEYMHDDSTAANLDAAYDYSDTTQIMHWYWNGANNIRPNPDSLSSSHTYYYPFIGNGLTQEFKFTDSLYTGELDFALFVITHQYTYVWNTGVTHNDTTSALSDLVSGNYVVVVTDGNGCMDSTDVTLVDPPQLDISDPETINVSCLGYDDGRITVHASGGTPWLGIPPKYTYEFNGPTNVILAQVGDPVTAAGLAPGIYTVTAEDANGCKFESNPISISEPTDALGIIDLDSINESCNLANGKIYSEVEGGVEPYSYLWSDPDAQTTATATDLVSGIYTVIVTDYNGCEVTDNIRVFGSMEIFLPGNLESFVDSICLGEIVDINIEEDPGFSYLWINDNDTLLNKTIDTINFENQHADITVSPQYSTNIYTLTISDPSCGSYDVIATIYVDSITPVITSDPGVETGEHPIVKLGDFIELYSDPIGGISPYTYSWQWDDDMITNSSGDISDSPEESVWYHLMVEDAEGCLGFDSIYVIVGVLPYEAITPNGDGINDEWLLEGMELYPDAVIQVFNRWGGLVYESVGGTDYQAWDGTNQGKDLAVGTYYYVIDLNTTDEPQTGTITIIR